MSRPLIGVGVLVFKDNDTEDPKILLSKRISSPGQGCWQNPGGHLEHGETPEMCALRELREETSLEAEITRKGPWINFVHKNEALHYVSIFIIVEKYEGVPKNLEPNKCEGWEWFPLRDLPKPLFGPLEILTNEHNLEDFVY